MVCEHRIFYLMDIANRVILIQDGKIANEYERNDFLKLSTKELNELDLKR